MKKVVVAFTIMGLLYACKTEKKSETKLVKSEVSTETNHDLSGITVMTFGPQNELIVGDSKTATIYAIETVAEEVKDPIPMTLKAIDKTIAGKLGVSPTELLIGDMKVHPVSQEVYIAVKRGHDVNAKSVIAIINPKDGEVRFLDFKNAKKTETKIINPVTNDMKFWREIPANSLSITDIDYFDGFLYVAGLTNGEFASTMRKIKYPFDGEQVSVAGIEMYHAVHTQKETRAPIRAMVFEELNNEPTLIASYTCTPLVTIPTTAIKEGNHIKAKTIAELGYGNIPIDMLTFVAQEQDGSYDKKLLITNKNRSGSLISLKDLAEANKGKGLTSFTQGPEGIKIFPVPLSGVMHIADQNQMMLALLRRNIETGSIDLLSELKGAYFRLSDYINEYDFEDYEYTEGGKIWKGFHDMAKQMEGFPELVSEEEKNK